MVQDRCWPVTLGGQVACLSNANTYLPKHRSTNVPRFCALRIQSYRTEILLSQGTCCWNTTVSPSQRHCSRSIILSTESDCGCFRRLCYPLPKAMDGVMRLTLADSFVEVRNLKTGVAAALEFDRCTHRGKGLNAQGLELDQCWTFVGAPVSTFGRGGFTSILPYKKKKSRIGLDGMSWGALDDATKYSNKDPHRGFSARCQGKGYNAQSQGWWRRKVVGHWPGEKGFKRENKGKENKISNKYQMYVNFYSFFCGLNSFGFLVILAPEAALKITDQSQSTQFSLRWYFPYSLTPK